MYRYFGDTVVYTDILEKDIFRLILYIFWCFVSFAGSPFCDKLQGMIGHDYKHFCKCCRSCVNVLFCFVFFSFRTVYTF